jgi:hypothetical protein
MGPRLREDDGVTQILLFLRQFTHGISFYPASGGGQLTLVSFHALLIAATLAADVKTVIPAKAGTHGMHPEAV